MALEARLLIYKYHPFDYIYYIILNNGILKLNYSILPSSEGFISQYNP